VIEHADVLVSEWAAAVTGSGVPVVLAPPSDDRTPATGVSVFLMELVSRPALRGERRTPLQLGLRYLVTTWAEDPLSAHRLLGSLVLAAMEVESFEVDLTPPSPLTWAALGAAPRPGFVLQVLLRMPRPHPVAAPVRGPLVVQGVALTRLTGVLLGPGDIPIAAARIELPAAGAATETDSLGRFWFPGVPAEPERKLVRVRARGRQLDVEIAQRDGSQPVVIRFEHLLEE
jgi:hypothetical protein